MFLLILATTAYATTMDRLTIDPTLYDARCNDGSVPIFYITEAPAWSLNPDKWLIGLQSHGDACNGAAECEDLHDTQYSTMGTGCTEDPLVGVLCDQSVGAWTFTTDTPWEATRTRWGIFSDESDVNPAFDDWNKVQIISCSSDLWTGDGGLDALVGTSDFETVDGSGFIRFDGAAIVGAVLDTLESDHGLDEATAVVLAGSGTGASGVMHHLDRALASNSVEVKGLVDSSGPRQLFDMWNGTTLNDNPANPGVATGCRSRLSDGTLPASTWYVDAYNTWSATVDESCGDVAGAAYGTGAPCLFPDYMFLTDTIDTPFFYRQDFADSEGIADLEDYLLDPATGAPTYADAESCFIQTQHSRGLNAQRASRMAGFFLSCEGQHAGLSYDVPYSEHTANGEYLNELVERFVDGTSANTRAAEAGCLLYPLTP